MRFFLLLPIILLVSCAAKTGNQITAESTFNAASPNGLVIVGFDDEREFDGQPKPKLNWRRFDPATMRASGELIPVSVPSNIKTVLYDDSNETSRPYYVFELPPGNYYIESLFQSYDFKKAVKREETANRTVLLGSYSPSITVRPGEILYIGEYRYGVDGAAITRLNPAPPQIERARSLIATYNGVFGNVVYREPKPVKFSCNQTRTTFQREFNCAVNTVSLAYQ